MTRDHLPIKPQPGLDIEEFDIPARDNHPIRVRSYKQSNSANLPLLIYLHGGGFVTGGLETDDESCRAIAADIPLLALNVEYRLAPEHRFPVGFEDSRDVVYWAASPTGQQRLSTNLQKGFILGGTSAGANFTAGIAHLAAHDGLQPRLTGLLFLAGSFCHPDARPAQYRDRILSVDEINDAPGLTRKSIDYFAGSQCAEKYGAPPSDKRLSPLLFESHANIAFRAAFYICGWDPRRDEAFLFDELLTNEGVLTMRYVYKGLPHGFWTTCPDLEESKGWRRDLLEGVRFLLAREY
ncbi:alpha/beta-hydrolase [Aspergillus steynii IBT 23096]|uniref:Alpha/beta-hydrolase n=1 Tax=Aspergillus steynii IBT 23096 TaxID=1392250 RepID=A0A2I2GNM5_9EURO|nr:alpha/beta-hydrolase [Aspergillus steynii IBT 23096]PLB54466.1 alpha/beta-hydrolase [Aspergillus steynii IBT 23096]